MRYDKHENLFLLAALITVVHVIDTDGAEAASWYHDEMSWQEILVGFVVDIPTTKERLDYFAKAYREINECVNARDHETASIETQDLSYS